MIKGIGSAATTGIGTQRGGEAKGVGAGAGVGHMREARDASIATPTTLGRIVAEGPPVETDRVVAIRAAIRGGGYKADADAIAAKMIATDLS